MSPPRPEDNQSSFPEPSSSMFLGKKKMPKKKSSFPKKGRDRGMEMDLDYINSLRQRVRDLESQLAEQVELIQCLERKERRVRIWSVSVTCATCKKDQKEFVALINRKVFQGPDFMKLVSRLRGMGYFVKEVNFAEVHPTESRPFDGEVSFLKDIDILDLKIPEGIGDEFQDEIKKCEDTPEAETEDEEDEPDGDDG